MAEDASRVFLLAERGQRRDDGKGYRGHCQQTEQADIDRGNEVHQAVESTDMQQSQYGTDDKGAKPKHQPQPFIPMFV